MSSPPPAAVHGSSRRRLAWLAGAVLSAAAAIAALLIALREPGRPKLVRIATGTRGGTFLPLGTVLAEGLGDDLRGTTFRALESPGGVASVRMLESRRAELALLSNHVAGSGALRLIAPLYEETLQVVVRRGAGIATPFDLRGRRVSLGPRGSGTETIARAVLTHFGLSARDVRARHLSMQDAAEAFERSQLDAAFMVAGMRTPAVDRLLAQDGFALLSLGAPGEVGSALEGIRLDAPFFAVTTIPVHAYGRQPSEPVGTISVRALLVARADLPDDLVYAITESLFEHKVELSAENQLLAHLTERLDLSLSPYPLHPGADQYYRRAEPTFIERYVDEISLAITVGALLWSAAAALAAARRGRRRARIEERFRSARELAVRARSLDDPDAMRAARDQLVAFRERAIEDLAAEQLDANDAFVILQDYVTAQIAELERRITPLA